MTRGAIRIRRKHMYRFMDEQLNRNYTRREVVQLAEKWSPREEPAYLRGGTDW